MILKIHPNDNSIESGNFRHFIQRYKISVIYKFELSFSKSYITTMFFLDILVMLTPCTGQTDPSKDLGQKDNLMTNLQFFPKTFSFEFYSMGSMHQSV